MEKLAVIVFYVIVFQSMIYSKNLSIINKELIDSSISKYKSDSKENAVIIVKPSTMEILYMYNPEICINGRFPPGSLIKPLSAAIVLENTDKTFNSSKNIECSGKFKIPSEILINNTDINSINILTDKGINYLKCSKSNGHGVIGLNKAIIDSCNFYFLSASSSKPEEFYHVLISKWHLNDITSSRISGTKEKKTSASHIETPLKKMLSSIGEGGLILVSPLKISQIYSSIYEGTPLLSPFVYPETKIVEQYPCPLNENERNFIVSSLRGVASSGTLSGIKSPPDIKILAGKTGTGTKVNKKYSTHGWNCIIFSYRGNTYLMVTFVMNGRGPKEAITLSQSVLLNFEIN